MTKQQNLKSLGARGRATPVATPSKKDLILLFIDGYEGKLRDKFSFGPVYTRIYDIEHTKLNELRHTATLNTALEPMARALRDRGIDTGGTVGGLMDAVGFTQEDLHKIVCHCHGALVSGHQMAERLKQLPDAQ